MIKTNEELYEIKLQIADTTDEIVMIPRAELLALLDQAMEQQSTIKRWFAFLSMMQARSSWSGRIQQLLDDYMYGKDASKADKQRAENYAAKRKIHL